MRYRNRPPNSATSRQNANKKLNLIQIVDMLAKFIGAGVAIAVAFIAHSYQSSISTSSLQVQREQSESNLRTGMFRDLTSPIIGSKDGDISIEREQLLVELLVLNFHEHFVLKPLLIHIDDRLADENSKEMNAAQRESSRNSLRSAARRVIEHQLASLSKADSDPHPELRTCIYYFQLEEKELPKFQLKEKESPTLLLEEEEEKSSLFLLEEEKSPLFLLEEEKLPLFPLPQSPKGISPAKRDCSYRQEAFFDEQIKVESPNGVYALGFTINAPDTDNWQNQRFKVSMIINKNESKKNKNPADTIIEDTKNYHENKHLIFEKQVGSPEFQLTWFDFPFSDNTLLADGTRFSLVMDKVDRENIEARVNRATFKLAWFPVDYFSALERPVNHRQVREQLGLELQQSKSKTNGVKKLMELIGLDSEVSR